MKQITKEEAIQALQEEAKKNDTACLSEIQAVLDKYGKNLRVDQVVNIVNR